MEARTKHLVGVRNTLFSQFSKWNFIRKLLCFGACSMLALFKIQGQDIASDIAIPPSPNAASLGQYGEIPVDKFTGIPNISIPLYTIQVDDIALPISLSFHAGGHKVKTVASWVGLGWSLNAGGVVTRSMRVRPDESGYFTNINEVLDWEDQGLMNWIYQPYVGSDPDITALKQAMFDFYDRKYDTESDIFYYNFPGGSGKFMFHPDQSLIHFPYQDFRIEATNMTVSNNSTPSSGNIGGFDIFDLNGIRYKFESTEESIVDNSGDPFTYESSWFLDQIYSQRSGKSIAFTYSNQITQTQDNLRTDNYVEQYDVNNAYTISNSEYNTTNQIKSLYLETISWEGGSIVFTRSGGRLDVLNGGYQLDLVEIKDHNGTVIKSYEFEYDYYYSNTHLRLLSVTEKGINGLEKPPYTFEYYEGVPSRDSFDMDHFGYYNGSHGNYTLVPDFQNYYTIWQEKANREPGNGTSIVGMLNKLHYPTGGHTSFNYEAHDYPGTGQVTDATTAVAEKCDANGNLYVDGSGNGVMGLFCEETDSKVFTVPTNSVSNSVDIRYDYDLNNAPSAGSGTMEVKIYKITGTTETLHNSYSFNGNPTETDPNSLTVGNTYRVEATTDVQGVRVAGTASAIYNQPQNKYTGGVRIASMVNYDENNNITKDVRYDYTLNSDPSLSSGKFIARPLNYSTTYSVSVGGGGTFINHHAAPVGVLSGLDGNHIVYQEVYEYEVGKGGVRSYYNTDFDEFYPQGSSSPSEGGFSSNFWKRGTLEKEEILNENGDKLQTTDYHYTYIHKDTSSTFIYEIYDEFPGAVNAYEYKYDFNREIMGWVRLDSTVSKYHLDQLENTVTHTYQTNSPLILPVAVDYQLGNSQDYSETITYLDDRTDHVIAPIVNKKRFDNQSNLLQETKNYYSASHKLDKTEILNSTGQIIAETSFSEHNGLKPSYIQPHTGVDQVLVWGYDNTVPIAHVVNATYGEVMDELPVNFDAGSDGFSAIEEIDLRAGLPSDAQVTTYTHKPLVGLMTLKDPNEIITNYEYDDLMRLETVRENGVNGNILQQYNYHYDDGTGASPTSPELSLSTGSLNSQSSGMSTNVTVTSNIPWSVSTDASWIILSPQSGSNNGTVSIDVIENGYSTSRTDTVKVEGGILQENIIVSQDGANNLSTSTNFMMFNSTGAQTFTITSNVSWTITTTYWDGFGWVSKNPTSGSGNATISVSLGSVQNGWEADLNITGGGLSETVHIVYFSGF